MRTFKNRYEDEFIFSLDDEGNILWEGNFEWCRFGMPNDYAKSYNAYVGEGGKLSFNEFQHVVHEYDKETNQFKYPKYLQMIESIKDKINMVDPSGGPYIESGNNMGRYGEEFEGMIVKEFKKIPTGYKIVIK
jgi:hypothetical protein